MRAAEMHVKLRLYGSLMPYSGSLPVPREKLPTLQFIAENSRADRPRRLSRRQEDHHQARRHCAAQEYKVEVK